jgi:hypothetical protein
VQTLTVEFLQGQSGAATASSGVVQVSQSVVVRRD